MCWEFWLSFVRNWNYSCDFIRFQQFSPTHPAHSHFLCVSFCVFSPHPQPLHWFSAKSKASLLRLRRMSKLLAAFRFSRKIYGKMSRTVNKHRLSNREKSRTTWGLTFYRLSTCVVDSRMCFRIISLRKRSETSTSIDTQMLRYEERVHNATSWHRSLDCLLLKMV